MTPEFCLSESFRRHIKTVYSQRELSRIAIDEAHCISEWGHDFRTAYKELIWFKREFSDVPIMCLTATATQRVREDIITTLGLDEGQLKTFTMTTSRRNLHYEVRFKSDDTDHFLDFLAWLQAVHNRRSLDPTRKAELTAKGERLDAVSGIIYTSFRKDCETLASRLRSHNIGAAPYHAGLSAFDREDCQRKWLADEPGYDIIVATTAFGMGIDKENVRFVVHWQIPKSFEGFYQEAGRAGRDGKASLHIMYYSRGDRDRAAYRISKDQKPSAGPQSLGRKKSFQTLVEYCEHTERCRHRLICEYFGEEGLPECDYACDWHKDKVALKKRKSEGLACEEWVSTQSERPEFYGEGYD